MRISVHLLTCPGREAVLAETLASWRRMRWAAEPQVYLNPDARPEVPERVAAGFVHLF